MECPWNVIGGTLQWVSDRPVWVYTCIWWLAYKETRNKIGYKTINIIIMSRKCLLIFDECLKSVAAPGGGGGMGGKCPPPPPVRGFAPPPTCPPPPPVRMGFFFFFFLLFFFFFFFYLCRKSHHVTNLKLISAFSAISVSINKVIHRRSIIYNGVA